MYCIEREGFGSEFQSNYKASTVIAFESNLTDKLSQGHAASISSVIQTRNTSEDKIGVFFKRNYLASATRKPIYSFSPKAESTRPAMKVRNTENGLVARCISARAHSQPVLRSRERIPP